MFDEFSLEVFSIKIKIKSILENITDKSIETKETIGIKNKNKITYYIENTKHSLELKDEEIILKRENEEFIHGILFTPNKTTNNEYYIKDLNANISVKIKTNKLKITKDTITINYETIDNNNKFVYKVEMSDKK